MHRSSTHRLEAVGELQVGLPIGRLLAGCPGLSVNGLLKRVIHLQTVEAADITSSLPASSPPSVQFDSTLPGRERLIETTSQASFIPLA